MVLDCYLAAFFKQPNDNLIPFVCENGIKLLFGCFFKQPNDNLIPFVCEAI